MIKKQFLKRSAGNKLYSIVGWFCYIACTIISAVLNIYLLSKLDQSWAWFLLTMSLALEFGKAYILIRANTYRSLSEYLANCKFKSSKVIKKEFTFYGIYILFAILSITASLSFSLTITDKTEQNFILEKQKISRNIDTLKTIDNEINNLFLEKEEVKNQINKLSKEETEYNIKTSNLGKEIAKKNGWDINKELKNVWGLPEYIYSEEKAIYNEIQKNVEEAKKYKEDVNKKIDEKNKERELFINNHGTINNMIDELDALKEQEKEMAGSSKCFILLAETFGIPDKVKQIKFFILLFVSLLVELCIWLSSPDLRLDGDLLYSFRNDLGLSTKKDVDKLLKEIKDTNTRFSFKEEKPEVKVIEKIPQKTLKELDNLKEQVELLSREKEEMIATSKDAKCKYEDQIEMLKNKLNTLEDSNDLLEARDIEIEELRKELDVLNDLISEKTEFIEKLDKELKETQEDQNEFADIHNGTVDRMYEQEKTIKELEQKLSERAKDVESQKDIISNLSGRLNELEEKNSILSSDANNAYDSYKTLDENTRKEILDLKEKVKKIKGLYKEEIEGYKKQIDDLSKNKYTEDDIKQAIKETAEKSKEKISNLSSAIKSWEEKDKKLSDENNNLILTNKNLERKLEERSQRVRSAEEELEEMID